VHAIFFRVFGPGLFLLNVKLELLFFQGELALEQFESFGLEAVRQTCHCGYCGSRHCHGYLHRRLVPVRACTIGLDRNASALWLFHAVVIVGSGSNVQRALGTAWTIAFWIVWALGIVDRLGSEKMRGLGSINKPVRCRH
jgi:hypothetical protein